MLSRIEKNGCHYVMDSIKCDFSDIHSALVIINLTQQYEENCFIDARKLIISDDLIMFMGAGDYFKWQKSKQKHKK